MRKTWLVFLAAAAVLLGGCSKSNVNQVKLDPNHPVTITIWHYYNGGQKTAFDEMVGLFNETKGKEEGIFVECHNQGDVVQLEESVMASIDKKVGSEEIPNIFASYSDTAYTIEKKGLLVNIEEYLTEEEIAEYVDSYIEEGRIGLNGELEIFPIAKSSEVFMLNKTDWDKFAEATGASLDSLKEKKGLVKTAKTYYEWTDSLTPAVANDGRAFYGRDAIANMFVIGSLQMGKELFHVENQKVTLNIDKNIMRTIWDDFYIPYIKGYYASYGKFRSDDMKIGKIIALTGSTTTALYFPDTVEGDYGSYPIESIVLPVPSFNKEKSYAIQQGAGMVITKSTKEQEYASVEFLKWFTESERNVEFSGDSGYLPVKKEANSKELLDRYIQDKQLEVDDRVYEVVTNGYDIVNNSILYTSKAFDGGKEARKILEYNLKDKAVADRELVTAALAEGKTLEEAAAPFLTDENFESWYQQLKEKLEAATQ